MGIPLKDLIDKHAGGVIGGWNNLQAVIPGGSSMPLLPKNICETITMDFDSLIKAKSGLGTAGVVVINKDQDIINCMARIAKFYKHETCGQCTPCREGTVWLVRILTRLVHGEGKDSDIDMLLEITDNIGGLIDFSKGSFGKTICPFGEAVAWPVRSFVEKFETEFRSCIQEEKVYA